MSSVRVQARLEQRGVQFDLALDDGEVLAVLGPNGVGKSTLLLMIAGLLRPDHGRIELGGAVVTVVIVPLVAILLKIDWPHFIPLVTSESSRAALVLSVKTAAASTAVCVLIGVPLALVLARGRFPGQSVLRALVLLPLVLPPVVGGIALLYTFGRQGLLGHQLELLGIRIAFSTTAVNHHKVLGYQYVHSYDTSPPPTSQLPTWGRNLDRRSE